MLWWVISNHTLFILGNSDFPFWLKNYHFHWFIHSLCKLIFNFFFSCNNFKAWQYPCFPILFNTRDSQCSMNGRSFAVCSKRAYLEDRQQMNGLSAFIDASNVYSNVPARFQQIREKKGKIFKLWWFSQVKELPYYLPNPNKYLAHSFIQNWQPTQLTTFVRATCFF